jgi:hypothetical protein
MSEETIREIRINIRLVKWAIILLLWTIGMIPNLLVCAIRFGLGSLADVAHSRVHRHSLQQNSHRDPTCT